MSAMDRRSFLGLAAAAVATSALGACASMVTTPVAPVGGIVYLPIRNYPSLASAGGSLKILPSGAATPLYILELEGGGYAVLSPICTHLGCTVNIEGVNLVCPCHGSTYDRAGEVLRGPAERSLVRIPSRLTEDGVLEIDLRGAD